MSKNKNGVIKKKGLTFASLNRIMILQFILMIILSLIITLVISSRAKENGMQHLSAVTDERAQIIINYVENSETLLDCFSKSPEVENFLASPNDTELSNAAQQYTQKVASSVQGLESMFICDFNAKALVHTRTSFIGNYVSERLSVDQLQTDIMNAKKSNQNHGVYVAGVISSASSGEPVIAMYKGIFDASSNPIGMVGLCISTENLIHKLEVMKTPGLERSFYSMIDVKQRVYVFDEDMQNACEPLVLPDLIQQCDIYENRTDTESTTYVFKLPKGAYAGGQNNGGSFAGASYFIPQYHWLLMMNDFTSEVYSLANTMRIFLGAFSILILAMMILFAFLNKKQEKVNQKLLSSVEAVEETKKSLNTAMFGDILTGASNRVKLATDLMGITDGTTNPYYFALFNIMEFSNINTAYGSDTGDALLARVAETLKAQFPTGEIYRTGSDEFVVMVKTQYNTPQMREFLFAVDEALNKLLVPEDVRGLGTLHPKYKVAAIKKTTEIDASVITILKEMTNAKGEAMCGMIDFVDMSE